MDKVTNTYWLMKNKLKGGLSVPTDMWLTALDLSIRKFTEISFKAVFIYSTLLNKQK